MILYGPGSTILRLILPRKAKAFQGYLHITSSQIFQNQMVINLTSLEEHDCDINDIFV